MSTVYMYTQFKEINNAKTILMNEQKRRIYDQYGSMGLKLADQIGEENLELYMCLDSKLLKVYIIIVSCWQTAWSLNSIHVSPRVKCTSSPTREAAHFS